MTSKQVMLGFLAIVAVALAQATEHMVGDNKGWTLNFNYTAWAQAREFHVGDSLVFKYPVGNHNVYKVGASDFATCRVPLASEAVPLTTGHDVINLSTVGRAWYLCGVANGSHCRAGLKLVVNIQPAWQAPAHSPSMPMWPAPASPLSAPSSWKAQMGWQVPAPSPAAGSTKNVGQWFRKMFFRF